MATVHIPPQMRDLTSGAAEVTVSGGSVRQVLAELESRYPGIEERLVLDGKIAPGLALSIDNEVTSLGLLARVGEESVVHIVAAIAGGV
jgi:molybdopterin converting factor small subunit